MQLTQWLRKISTEFLTHKFSILEIVMVKNALRMPSVSLFYGFDYVLNLLLGLEGETRSILTAVVHHD